MCSPADVRCLGHRRDHVVGEVPRMRAGEPHPLETIDLATRTQQTPEREPVAERPPVGVHVLAQQSDLNHIGLDQRPNLGEHVAGSSILLGAPKAGHDAEAAPVVAADRNGHPRGIGDSRLVGRSDGNVCNASTISICASWLCRARSSSTGRLARLCVPNTTSTHGARSMIPARSARGSRRPRSACRAPFLTGYSCPRLP